MQNDPDSSEKFYYEEQLTQTQIGLCEFDEIFAHWQQLVTDPSSQKRAIAMINTLFTYSVLLLHSNNWEEADAVASLSIKATAQILSIFSHAEAYLDDPGWFDVIIDAKINRFFHRIDDPKEVLSHLKIMSAKTAGDLTRRRSHLWVDRERAKIYIELKKQLRQQIEHQSDVTRHNEDSDSVCSSDRDIDDYDRVLNRAIELALATTDMDSATDRDFDHEDEPLRRQLT